MTSWILPEKEKPPSVDSDFSCIVLTVYKLTRNDFHSSTADVVHPLHPQHLIFRFEGFRYALFFEKLLYQPREHFLCMLVYVGNVTVQLAAYQQFGIEYLAVLFQIPQVSLSPYADMPWFFFRQLQAGKIVIALQFIPKSVFLVINVLIHFVILQLWLILPTIQSFRLITKAKGRGLPYEASPF